MGLLNKLERKYGKYAIKNLIVYILGAYVIGYAIYFLGVANILPMEFYDYLEMNPALIFRGQIWRLFTWICIMPQSPGLFLIFMFILYYWIGQTLERVWGTFRYNLFIFTGLILMTLGPIIIYGITSLMPTVIGPVNISCSTSYMNLTSFLAFAALFPDQKVYFMFILPIKMKWLAILDGVILGWQVINMGRGAILYWGQPISVFCLSEMVSILLSVANFLIFFLATRNYKRYSPKEVKRRKDFKREVSHLKLVTPTNGSRHRCVICGATEISHPDLEFRYCSKCNGDYEYCSNHIYTHEHKA